MEYKSNVREESVKMSGATIMAGAKVHRQAAVPSLTFAIDYDGTYSADPTIFRMMIDLLKVGGHQVIIVTGRSDDGEWGREVREAVPAGLPVVFAGNGWKREAAERAGFKVNVWMDDFPEYIGPQLLLTRVPAGEMRLSAQGTLEEVGQTRRGCNVILDLDGVALHDGPIQKDMALGPFPKVEIPVSKEMARAMGARVYDAVHLSLTVKPKNVTPSDKKGPSETEED